MKKTDISAHAIIARPKVELPVVIVAQTPSDMASLCQKLVNLGNLNSFTYPRTVRSVFVKNSLSPRLTKRKTHIS